MTEKHYRQNSLFHPVGQFYTVIHCALEEDIFKSSQAVTVQFSIMTYIPYRIDIYKLLNRTSSRIVRVAAASGLAQGFRIVLCLKSLTFQYVCLKCSAVELQEYFRHVFPDLFKEKKVFGTFSKLFYVNFTLHSKNILNLSKIRIYLSPYVCTERYF